jgi:CHAT domain-containing protein
MTRKYLLGLVENAEERESIELRLLSDASYQEFVESVEDELIEEYAFDELDEASRKAFEANFLLTEDRIAKLLLTRAIRQRAREAASAKPNVSAGSGWLASVVAALSAYRFRLATVSVAAVLISIAVWFYSGPSNELESALASLNKAYVSGRPVEGRISGFEYAPKTDLRGSDGSRVDEIARSRAERIALDAAAESESPAVLHALARVYLAKGELKQSLDLLTRVLARSPDNAIAMNDLGMVHLETAKTLGDADGGRKFEQAARALELFDTAITRSPALAEPRFNRALAIGVLGSRSEEAAAWRDYLEFDSGSQWAVEARKRLSAVEGESSTHKASDDLIREFLLAFRENDAGKAFEIVKSDREMITGKLIPQQLAFLFVDAVPGSAEAGEYLAAMRFIGDIEMQSTGDAFWRKYAAYYRASGAANSLVLKQAQDEVRSGYANSLQNRYEAALANFRAADRLFGSVGSRQDKEIAEYWIGYLLDRNGDLAGSKTILGRLRDKAVSEKHHWIASQALSWLAQAAFAENRFSDNFELLRAALEHAHKSRDVYLTQKLYEMLSLANRRVRSYEKALDHSYRSLNVASARAGSLRQEWRSISTAAEAFAAMGLLSAARVFERESLNMTRTAIHEATFEYMSLLRLGLLESRAGQIEKALELFAESRAVAEKFDRADGERHLAYLDLANAHAYRENGRCPDAQPLYANAVRYYDAGEFTVDRYDAYKGRLLCRLTEGSDAGVEIEVPALFRLLEENRSHIREESNRNSFFGGEQEIYDALIDFELDRGRPEKAFEYYERSRARSLLDMMAENVHVAEGADGAELRLSPEFTEPQSLSSVVSSLPKTAQVLQFVVSPDRVSMLVIRADGLQARSVNIDRSRLSEQVRAFLSHVANPGEKGSEERKRVSDGLSEVLIEPVRSLLDPAKTLVIVPDKLLTAVPFAALYSRRTGTYLVEELDLQYASSASTFFLATAKASRLAGANERLLAVGDPSFDRSANPGLEKLEAAEREARSIAANYPDSEVLLGGNAAKGRIRRGFAAADVFHFAGHYILDPNSPLRSGMLVAGDDPLFTNRDVIETRPLRTRLVVLSACETGVGYIVDGEGMLGAARIFAAAGVPLVVASQWRVDSAATAQLMIRFHEIRRTEDQPSVRSLREAQTAMITGPDLRLRHPFYWASFIAYGGHALF